MNKSFLLTVVVLLASAFAHADYEKFPCRKNSSNTEIDLRNSDDLFFAGRFLARAGRTKEAIQCLNRGKELAPAYLDIRLELMYSFIALKDKKSAKCEGGEFLLFPMTNYYFDAYKAYRSRIRKMKNIRKPVPGFDFNSVPPMNINGDFPSLAGEEIKNEKEFRRAVSSKREAKFSEARKLLDSSVLPVNPDSPTVHFISGLVYFDLNQFKSAEAELTKTLELIKYDTDVILALSRVLNAQLKYSESFKLLSGNANRFEGYGCFQLGSALLASLKVLNPELAEELNILMDQALLEKAEAALCKKIEESILN